MVYKAVDLQLEVPVALKVIRPSNASDDKILERSRKKSPIARKGHAKNVRAHLRPRRVLGLKYISMEFIEGQDLAHIIEHEALSPFEQGRLHPAPSAAPPSPRPHSMGSSTRDLSRTT